MRKFRKESTAPETMGADRDSGNGWLSGRRCALVLGAIVVVAFLLRFVFAYGVSADGNFALSGGSSAQYHLHVIESILNGSWSLTDAAVNYPIGGSLYIPPLMDFLAAGVASIFQGSMGTTEAASFALGVLNPIFGALACIPVFLIGREMFDKTIGVVAALVFAFMALPISTAVFSSGNEYALAAFLLAFMAYFAVKMVKSLDSENSSKKGVLINGALAGVFLALSALTWNGFRIAVVLLAVAMVLQAVAARMGGKDVMGATIGYAVAILVGTLVPAAYYLPAGLMDAVYSGPLLIAIVSVVFVFVFAALKAKPWIVTIPSLVVAFIVLCVALMFAAPDLFNDFIFGNSVYTNSIMAELASNRVSMSNVAAYYGWLTMWLPICLAIYETYVYLRKDHSSSRLFMVVWLYVMFFAVWTSYANAAVVGSVFAVGSAAVIVKVLKSADLREWVATMKAAGFPGCLRKLIKPLPFVSVLVVALLVVVPNVSFAVDAGQPTNTEGDHYFTGNTSFTIKTGESYPLEGIWESYADEPKDGALVTWIDTAYDAVAQGNFSTVTDGIGGGSSAAAQVYLADGSVGAIAAMMLRIMMANPDADYSSAFGDHADVYSAIKAFIDNPQSAVDEITANPSVYGNVRTDITDENAVYLAGINELASSMNQKDLMDAYDGVCDASGEKIGYILVDGSMLPLQYNGGDSFSTIAYFADYKVDRYGAATEFYSYNTYYGSTVYTEAIYDTLLWRALIGPSASEAGFTNSYSYLVALSVSDGKEGSAKAIPGYGLAGFDVKNWTVMYNADNDATVSSDGWEYMPGQDAMKKQAEEGGVINYLSGLAMLEYTGSTESSTIYSGEVVSSSGTGISGATVSVYQYSETFGKEVVYSETKTFDGKYDALVPAGSYRIEVKIGNIVMQSFSSANPMSTVTVQDSEVTGAVVVNGEVYSGENMLLTLESDATSEKVQITDGSILIKGLLPGSYSYVLYGESGSSLGTGTIEVYPGASVGLEVVPKTYTITATVEDIFENVLNIDGLTDIPVVYATNEKTGFQFSAEVGEDGKAVITVVPGKYTMSIGNGFVSINSTVQNASSGNRTVTLKAYESTTVHVDNAPDTVLTISAGTFSTVSHSDSDGNVYFDIPKGLATDNVAYSVFGIADGRAYSAVYDGSGSVVTLTSGNLSEVTGELKDGDDAVSGIVTLYDGNGFQTTVSTDKDGKFTVLVPAGSYIMYAHNESDKVVLMDVSANGNTDVGSVSMVDGRKVTANLKYNPATNDSNQNLPYALALIMFEYEGTPYTLTSMTNTGGAAIFYIPDDLEATTSFNNAEGTLDNGIFTCTDMTREVTKGTSQTSTTVTIQYVGYEENQKNTVNKITITAGCDMELEFYESDDGEKITVKKGETIELCPGQYEVKIDGESGFYYDGTAYLYPGSTEFVGLDAVEVISMSIEKNEADKISISTEDGEYHAFSGGYYFAVGYVYNITSTGTTGTGDDVKDTIKYATLDLTGDYSGVGDSIDMRATAAEMKVTGYVGIVADGAITVKYGDVEREFSVADGAYTLVLPSDVGSVDVTVSVSKKIDSEEQWYSADGTFTGMKDGSIRNIPVVNSDKPESEEEEDEDAPEFDVTIDSAMFSEGDAIVDFTIENLSDVDRTYFVTAGSAWALDSAYSFTVLAGQKLACQVWGTYDESRVAPGLDDVTLIVKDINGTSTITEEITENSASSSSDKGMDILTSKDDEELGDRVSASQYMFAVKFVNKDVSSKDVTFSFTVPQGWYATICDESGKIVGAVDDVYTIYGLQTVTYYIALMQQSSEADAEKVDVPTVNVKVDGKDLELEPTEVNVENTNSTVSGGDALNERSGVPSGIWILVCFVILMLIATFWLASKRGVFARK